MPLDVAVAPQTLTSTLFYLKRGAEKAGVLSHRTAPGVPRSNGINDPHEVTIEDARGRESEFTLDRNGFALIKSADRGPRLLFSRGDQARLLPGSRAPAARQARRQPSSSSSTTTCETPLGLVWPCRRVRCITTTR